MLENKPLLTEVKLIQQPSDDFAFYHLYPFKFNKNITIIMGENGIGKSTFLEVLAVKLGCPAEGGSINFHYSTNDSHFDYSQSLRLVKSGRKIHDIFFYRSESFYNFISEMQQLDQGIGGGLIRDYYGGKDLHQVSHGESMKSLYHHRFKAQGLYILDEPEASLSMSNQIDFIEKILQLSKQGSQFIIATHSPLIMAMPDADLFRFSQHRYYPLDFFESNEYYLLKNIINSQGQFLKDILNY
ncbi:MULTISPECIES: AAA family ATPase [unclassified Acinetobacter]|uniref:AAA family ATPase n=1 Tax=unclassified Acinetobacter TaxID=196816 RepID=UPI0035B6D05C